MRLRDGTRLMNDKLIPWANLPSMIGHKNKNEHIFSGKAYKKNRGDVLKMISINTICTNLKTIHQQM